MSRSTTWSMHDARDAEDTRLLEAGEYGLLVEGYYGVILDRCAVGVRRGDPVDVAHEVVVRVMGELKRGRRYRVPFRVVVHQVTTWKIKEHFGAPRATEVELEDWMHEASTEGTRPLEELLADQGFEALLAGLTKLEQEVVRLRYGDDLDFGDIAERLGKEPNAVHQIHFRALAKLRRDPP